MKLKIVTYLLFVLMLFGCSSPVKHVLLSPECSDSGIVLSSEVKDTSRGYPYRFMIYLPPCYEADADPGYPVIFLVPGRGGGIGDWFAAGVDEMADQLILAGDVAPFVLVTTETTSNDPYADEIYDSLIPHIEANYNLLIDRDYRAVAGGSLGGIAAYRLVFQHPDEFSSAGMFGSGVINGENDQVASWLAASSTENKPRVFINVGEQDPLMLDQANVMVSILEEANVDYEFIVGEGAHTYHYWASNFANYFRWVAEDW